MSFTILDGKVRAKQIELQIIEEVQLLKSQNKRVPGLGVILVGENPASKAYVRNKENFAKRCGFFAKQIDLSESSTEVEVLAKVNELNNDSTIDGILVQLPLPPHINSNRVIEAINPNKDADGLHSVNQGKLVKDLDAPHPCTPSGIMSLIDFYLGENADLSGKRAVVIGRSVLVGKPVGLMLLKRNATVTFAHSKTKDLSIVCKEADILVAAVGIPNFVKSDWVKDGAIVLDVGINRLSSGELVGDVDFSAVKERVKAITPVPGGVGPMTVAMLMKNTLKCRKLAS